MQLNIYVPKDRSELVAALDRRARQTGRPKSDLVMEALERYLARPPRQAFKWEPLDIEIGELPSRAEMYEEWQRARS